MKGLIITFIAIVTILVFIQTIGVLYMVKNQNNFARTRYETTKQAVIDAMAETYFAE